VFPYWQYKSMEDGGVRPAHAALDGIVLPCNHEFWKSHFPPWQWNCRCQCIPLSEDDYADIAKEDADKPKDRRSILDDNAQAELTSTRRLVRNGVAYNVSSDAEKGKEGAYSWHPDNLRPDLERLRERHDPAIFAKFEQFARAQTLPGEVSVWDWLKGAELPTPVPVTVPPSASPGRQPKRTGGHGGGRSTPAAKTPWKPRTLSDAEIAKAMANVHFKQPEPHLSTGGEKIHAAAAYAARLTEIADREREALRRHYAMKDIYKAEAKGAHGEEIATWSNAEIRALKAQSVAERNALPPPQGF
jgi:hypothetical protein